MYSYVYLAKTLTVLCASVTFLEHTALLSLSLVNKQQISLLINVTTLAGSNSIKEMLINLECSMPNLCAPIA